VRISGQQALFLDVAEFFFGVRLLIVAGTRAQKKPGETPAFESYLAKIREFELW